MEREENAMLLQTHMYKKRQNRKCKQLVNMYKRYIGVPCTIITKYKIYFVIYIHIHTIPKVSGKYHNVLASGEQKLSITFLSVDNMAMYMAPYNFDLAIWTYVHRHI